MNLRWLAPILGCTLAVATVVSKGNETDSSGAGWQGTVTLCSGEAILHRDGKAYRVLRGAGVRRGDRIESDRDAIVTVSLNSGPVVSLGSRTDCRIEDVDGHWDLSLQSGEVRIVHDGKSELHLDAGPTVMSIERAILQLDYREQRTRFQVLAGAVMCETESMSADRFVGPQAFEVDATGRVQGAGLIQWNLQQDQIRLVSALQTSPVLQAPPVSTATPGATPETPPSPSDTTPLADTVTPQDDDEDEPRIAQQPGETSTRSGFDDGFNSETGVGASTNTFAGSSSLSLGSLSSASGAFSSGGLFGDANQQTFQGKVTNDVGPFMMDDPFPGAIHLVTAQTRFPFQSVQLSSLEFSSLFPTTDKYFSIGTGAAPTTQVTTNFFTGTSVSPNVVDIPRFGGYLVELDQYAITDPVQGGLNSNVGLTGLIGTSPTGPTVIGATPLDDNRAKFNDGATFALGEFLVTANGSTGITFAVRRSDQDRLIVKDPGGNDAQDQVTPNSDVTFVDSSDPRFLPQASLVKVPDSVSNTGTGIRDLDLFRRAAFTTLVADQLQDYSRRTGQTRFVVDGKIIDISGYQPASP